MKKSATLAIIFILTLTTAGYSQDSQRRDRPDALSGRPEIAPGKAAEMRPSSPESSPSSDYSHHRRDDTASKATLSTAEESALRSEATIFALDANSIYETNPKGRPVLEKLTQETGGFVLSGWEDADLKDAFTAIEKILRSQYARYPPPELEANGSFRPIETVRKRDWRIHARKGLLRTDQVAYGGLTPET
jgi:hypothetical protein